MRINNNLAALRTYTNLLRTGRDMSNSVNRLSSGFRINSLADDPAGFSIARQLRHQIDGMSMAARNSLDGISLVGTAEGALNEVHNMLQRIRELAVQAANDTNTDDSIDVVGDKTRIQNEIDQLWEEIRDIAYKTEFNSIKILGGEAERVTAEQDDDFRFPGLRLQVGASSGQIMKVHIPDIRAIIDEIFYTEGALGVNFADAFTTHNIDDLGNERSGFDRVNVRTAEEAQFAIGFADRAIQAISTVRSHLGAIENRLRHTEANLNATRESTEAALSRIQDTDMALEMTFNVKLSVIQQAGIAILGQANQRPHQILQLLH